jgi:hypothetical protein
VTALRFVNIFTAGVAAGGLFVVLFSYARALPKLPSTEIGRLHGLIHPPTHVTMQGATMIGAGTAVAIGVWDDPSARASTVLVFAGIIGAAIQAVLSRFWVVPWSDEMIAWPEKGVPSDYLAFLKRWTTFHAGRVFGAFLAFTCYLLSALLA